MRPDSWEPPDPRAAAGDRLELNGRVIVLEASLWRSFMPLADPADGDRNLHVALRVHDSAGGELPEGLEIAGLCVRRGSEEWAPPQLEYFRESHPDALTCVARGGPAWPIGESVDVFASVRRRDGPPTWLAARGVAVQRVD